MRRASDSATRLACAWRSDLAWSKRRRLRLAKRVADAACTVACACALSKPTFRMRPFKGGHVGLRQAKQLLMYGPKKLYKCLQFVCHGGLRLAKRVADAACTNVV